MGDDSRLVSVLILSALYLPGLEGSSPVNRRRWVSVERLLRLHSPKIEEAPNILKREGFWLEAGLLQRPGLLARVEALVRQGSVLTAACPGYPHRWLQILNGAAPPALWLRGCIPSGRFISIVGARKPNSASVELARSAASAAIEAGLAVCSGGAIGCDRAAANEGMLASKAAGNTAMVMEILPFGISHAPGAIPSVSVCPPFQTFSSAAAMERNALIYAAGERALVAEARFKEGGAWHGAVDCLRRRLSLVFAHADGSPASRALQALGANPASTAEDFLAPVPEESLLSAF